MRTGRARKTSSAGWRRRQVLGSLGSAGLLLGWPKGLAAQTPAETFGFEDVRALAEERASRDYAPPQLSLPDALQRSAAGVRFKSVHGLWRNDDHPFRIALAHLGGNQRWPVIINVIDEGNVLRIPYRAEMFDSEAEGALDGLGPDFGFAGFRLHHSDADPLDFPEIGAFEGSSRFRLIGHGQAYGVSARALGINIATSNGEEVPRFTEFWLQRPAPDAEEVTFYGLLDSPSLTGAYRFVVRPGLVTVVEIGATLFARSAIEKLGIAPLSAMYLYGPPERRRFDDFRPAVHGSQGLLMNNGQGNWLWRPLANHETLQVSTFVDDGSQGYGLFQRDRAFSSYQDLSTRFDRMPSVWIEPIGAWGPGWVELVEIPSDRDRHENVVAYWVGGSPVAAGARVDVAYRLHAQGAEPRRPPLGRVEGFWIGRGREPESRRFVLDFVGGRLGALGAGSPPEPVFSTRRGRLGPIVVTYNNVTNGWRVSLDLHPEGEESCEPSGFLQYGGEPVTETWVYRWTGA